MKKLAFAFFLYGGASAFAASVTIDTYGFFSGPESGYGPIYGLAGNENVPFISPTGATIWFVGYDGPCTLGTECALGSIMFYTFVNTPAYFNDDVFAFTVNQNFLSVEGAAATITPIYGPIGSITDLDAVLSFTPTGFTIDGVTTVRL